MSNAFKYVVRNHGIASDASYPYVGMVSFKVVHGGPL